MKKNIGNALALYPTPLVVVGLMVNGKPNWLLVGHLGIMGHDHVMVSLASAHYTNQGIKESKKLSINIVDETSYYKQYPLLSQKIGQRNCRGGGTGKILDISCDDIARVIPFCYG